MQSPAGKVVLSVHCQPAEFHGWHERRPQRTVRGNYIVLHQSVGILHLRWVVSFARFHRYSRNYAKYAELAGISYTTYYTDYEGMTPDDRGQERFAGERRKEETNTGDTFI